MDNLVTPTRNEYGEALKKYLYVSALTLPSIDTKAQLCRLSSGSPFLARLSQFQFILHYAKHVGPPSFRSFMMDWLPIRGLKLFKDVVMKMDLESRKIYDEKKAVLASGDEGFVKQVGEGKDIISILREPTPFRTTRSMLIHV